MGKCLGLIFICAGLCFCLQAKQYDATQLMQWQLAGIGHKEMVGQDLKLTEGVDSQGLVLLSLETWGDSFHLEFKVKPNQHQGVLVVLVSAADKNTGGLVKIPEKYDGNFAFWKSKESVVNSYAFAFHTGYHQPNAFVRRNPGFINLPGGLKPDIATAEKWYSVTLVREAQHLWLNIDGIPVLDAFDNGVPLGGGQIGFRLRGPGDGSFSALYRDVNITNIKK